MNAGISFMTQEYIIKITDPMILLDPDIWTIETTPILKECLLEFLKKE